MPDKLTHESDVNAEDLQVLIQAQLASLKGQHGFSELSITMRDGKYFLVADGRLIEITFANGKIISTDPWENLRHKLSQAIEHSGPQQITQSFGPTETIGYGQQLNQSASHYMYAGNDASSEISIAYSNASESYDGYGGYDGYVSSQSNGGISEQPHMTGPIL